MWFRDVKYNLIAVFIITKENGNIIYKIFNVTCRILYFDTRNETADIVPYKIHLILSLTSTRQDVRKYEYSYFIFYCLFLKTVVYLYVFVKCLRNHNSCSFYDYYFRIFVGYDRCGVVNDKK